MPTVTALCDARRGRIAVELDGRPWRTLPVDVVARAGIADGCVLDRPALRLLRRELRRAEALAVAGRALRSRDHSRHGLAARLERAGVDETTTEESLETLERARLVDDARFARSRAAGMAERGYGDAAIRHDLERQGVGADLVAEALQALEPEPARARRIVERRGPGPKTARFLGGKGFGDEVVEAALGPAFCAEP